MVKRCSLAVILIVALASNLVAHIDVSNTAIKWNEIDIAYGATGPLMGVYIFAQPSTASGNGSSYAITDGNGQYSMTTGLMAGTYNLTAFGYGYISSNIGPVNVVTGQTTAGINFVLQASGGISGKITEEVSGTPINGTIVFASFSSGGGTFGGVGTTGSDGSYLINTDLSTGTYNVSVFMPTGYIGEMTTTSVVTGLETKNVNLQLARSGIISGKVSAPNGTGLFGVSITTLSSGGGTSYFGFATTDVLGNFRIGTGLGTGTYTVYANGAGNYTAYGGFFTPIPVSVTAGQETSNINMELTPVTTLPTPSGTIRGWITDTGNNPIGLATVTVTGSGGTNSNETDADGYYSISEDLGTGNDYSVSVTSSGYYDATYPTLVSITVGQTTPNINIQMTAKPAQNFGTITGTVTGDTVVVPEFPNAILYLMTLTLVSTMILLTLKTRRYTSKDAPILTSERSTS
ncbi:carboxypeptidase-like regulatory domain-containing protein [Candidatus Bathyarchaeota archaeon]|nr:carboxypeptidase-like regulatory domain-containing protein [Candidatus Bathyarchaeota archaeon]